MTTSKRDVDRPPHIKIEEFEKRVTVNLRVSRKRLQPDKQTLDYVFCDYEGVLANQFEIEPGIYVPVSVRLVIECRPEELQKARIRNILQDRRSRVIKSE